MENKKEKVVAPESEEVVEIEDVDVGLKKEHVKLVEEETKKKVKEQHVLTKEQQELYQQILQAAEMPVKLCDPDFKMGKNELDIRYLSRMNKEQMMFRQLTLQNVYLKQLLTSAIDISRLLMIIADKLGVENLIQATDDIIEKTAREEKIREKLKAEKEAKEKAKNENIDTDDVHNLEKEEKTEA